MGKTKEQILNEQKTQKEIEQMPVRLLIDKLSSIKDLICTTKPMEVSFGEEQKWESIWSEDELETLKHKALTIVRDM